MGTNKISLINILADFKFSEFPGETPPFTFFAKFTDAAGLYEVSVEIHDLAHDVIVAVMPPIEVEIDDRLADFNLLIRFSPIPIPHAGAYDVIVVVDGQELEHQRYPAILIDIEED